MGLHHCYYLCGFGTEESISSEIYAPRVPTTVLSSGWHICCRCGSPDMKIPMHSSSQQFLLTPTTRAVQHSHAEEQCFKGRLNVK